MLRIVDMETGYSFDFVGVVSKIYKSGVAYVSVQVPESSSSLVKTFGVEDLADNRWFQNKTKIASKVKKLRNRLLIPLTRSNRFERMFDQKYTLEYYPRGEGNWKSSALSHLLYTIGRYTSLNGAREEIIRYLKYRKSI